MNRFKSVAVVAGLIFSASLSAVATPLPGEDPRRAVLRELMAHPDKLEARQRARAQTIKSLLHDSEVTGYVDSAWASMAVIDGAVVEKHRKLLLEIHRRAAGGGITPEEEAAFQSCVDEQLAARRVSLYGSQWLFILKAEGLRIPEEILEPELSQAEAASLLDLPCLKAMAEKGIEETK